MRTIEKILKLLKYKTLEVSVFIIGFFALLWFLIRVIPKPSRAFYPCQKTAFPFASAFVIWISGTLFSHTIVKKAKQAFGSGKFSKAFLFGFIAAVVFTVSFFVIEIKDSVFAASNYTTVVRQGELLQARDIANNNEDLIDPKAKVAIVKSEKGTAAEITFDDINTMIRQAVEIAGGFDTLVQEGDLVVIKPNVIAARVQGATISNGFPQEANGIATDYRVIQVVVNMVREKNASGKIILIEGSGYGMTKPNITALGYYTINGLDSIICLDENITSWYDPESPTLKLVSLPTGKNLYSSANKYYLNKTYFDADVLISLPVLKSHYLTGITGGIKNVGIGATPVEMYGNGGSLADDFPGRWNHIQHGDFSTQTIPLDKWIHDFYLCKPVDYVIMDGLQGAQYGPYPNGRSLSSVQKNLRVILAGKDPLAIDAMESLIAGFDPYKIGHLVLLANDDAGILNPSYIKVLGTQVHEIKTPFGEDNPGALCKYSDFTAPYYDTLTSCTISDNEINVSLISGDDVVKAEIAYDDTILAPIIINNFSSISVPFTISDGDASKVSVLLYDKYLNCTKLSLEHPFNGIQNTVIESINVYPNPATTVINFILPEMPSQNFILSIFSLNGKLLFSKKINGWEKQQLDISKFKKGVYFMQISGNEKLYKEKFTKI